MVQSGKVKITDLTDDVLKIEELGVILGGIDGDPNDNDMDGDGCQSGVCVNGRDVGAEKYCTQAVCTSGIGVCHENT